MNKNIVTCSFGVQSLKKESEILFVYFFKKSFLRAPLKLVLIPNCRQLQCQTWFA